VVVEAGDTLAGIAVQFGVDLEALIAANADTVPNPDLIYPGQVIRLP
jgi:LysM repeat protein